jgi:hypothetical protein
MGWSHMEGLMDWSKMESLMDGFEPDGRFHGWIGVRWKV